MQAGADVWVRGAEGWRAGALVGRDGGRLQVAVVGAPSVSVLAEDLKPRNAEENYLMDDLIGLTFLNEPAILHALQQRFERDLVYTFNGAFLVAVNPFKELDIYGERLMEQYRQTGGSAHVFAVAGACYRRMLSALREGGVVDQSIVISGESGAGKTESTRYILSYLTYVSAKTSSVPGKPPATKKPSIMAKIMASSPILNAFGNAKTTRNDNSSRFGKFIELYYNQTGELRGGLVKTYLLERVRVCSQQPAERNYHVFYQLLGAPRDKARQRWALPLAKDAQLLWYLSQGACVAAAGVDDKADLADMLAGFGTLEFSAGEVAAVQDVCVAVLHLGQLAFVGDGEGCSLARTPAVAASMGAIEALLGLSRASVEALLTTKHVLFAGELIAKPRRAENAVDVRDTLSKFLYDKLFSWLVLRINAQIRCASPEEDQATIGVLDIFGFESFQDNSFEQLCINYANEMLQQLLTRYVIKSEQDEYVAEDIRWEKIAFADNEDCLDLIANRKTGIFAMLNDECSMPQGSDTKLVSRMNAAFAKHARYGSSPAMKARSQFCVQHFAGPVVYTGGRFCEKNVNEVPRELSEFLSKSSLPLLRELFGVVPESATISRRSSFNSVVSDKGNANGNGNGNASPRTSVTGRSTRAAPPSVSNEFRDELQALAAKIESTRPSFVRCLKPNAVKAPLKFERQQVLEQLRYSGIVQAVEMARVGYPVRQTHAYFLRRYGCVYPMHRSREVSAANCKALFGLVWMKIPDAARAAIQPTLSSELQIGKTKVFLRQRLYDGLERCRSGVELPAIVLIQSVARMRRQRGVFRAARNRARRAAVLLQRCFRRFKAVRKFLRFRSYVITMQKVFRGNLARYFGS